MRWRPARRCLTNYTPVLAQAADGRRLALGASGGRRILPAVTQILSFVMDYGMDLDAAIHTPRIDASEGAIVIGDVRLPPSVRDALRAGFDYEEARVQTFPMKFACPSVVLRDGDTNSGATESAQPWGDAVAEGITGPLLPRSSCSVVGEGSGGGTSAIELADHLLRDPPPDRPSAGHPPHRFAGEGEEAHRRLEVNGLSDLSQTALASTLSASGLTAAARASAVRTIPS